MIEDLNEHFTLEYIAKEIQVSARQVSNYKNGDRPKGFVAIRLHLLHAKHFTREAAEKGSTGNTGTGVQDCSSTIHAIGTAVHSAEKP